MSNFVVNPYSFAVATVEFCQSNSNTESGFSGTNAVGNVVVSGNSVIGASCTALTGYLSRTQDPTVGTVYARVYNSSNVLQHTWNSIDASILTDPIETYTFTGSSYTIQEDDRVVFEVDESEGGANASVSTSAQSGWQRIERNDGTWTTPSTNVAIKMCITGIPA